MVAVAVRIREAAATLGASDGDDDVVLVRQALHIDAEVRVALAVDLHLVDAAALAVRRAALREEMPATADLRLWPRRLAAARALSDGSRVSQGRIVAVLTDVEQPLRLLLHKVTVLRVDIVTLPSILAVVDWWDVARGALRTHARCALDVLLRVQPRLVLVPEQLLIQTVLRYVLHLEALAGVDSELLGSRGTVAAR